MRQITKAAVNAFYDGQNFGKGNTTVVVNPDGILLYLFGNCIAYRDLHSNKVSITTAGFPTRTTLDRLNGLYGVKVSIKKGELYYYDQLWDGSWRWAG